MRHVLIHVFLLLLVSGQSASARQLVPTWRLEEELRIGSVDDDAYALSRVGSVLAGRDGRIYVSQPNDALVRIFDETGRAVGVVGRRGRGPGEFQRIDRMGFTDGDLWVADRTLTRVQVFGPDGQVGRTITGRYTAPGERSPGHLEALLGNGVVVAVPASASFSDTSVVVPVAGIDAAGQVRNATLFSLRAGARAYEIVTSDGIQASLVRPVYFGSLWDVSPRGDRIVIVDRPEPVGRDSQQFVVTIVSSSGTQIVRRTFRYLPEPLTDQSVRRLHAHYPASLAGGISRNLGRDSAVLHRHLAAAMTLPPFQSAVDRIVIANDNRILLRRGAAGLDEATWVVLSPEAELIGAFRAREDLAIHAVADDGRIWGVLPDDLEVPYIVRFRVHVAAPMPGASGQAAARR